MSQQTIRGTFVYAGGFLGTMLTMESYHVYSWIGLPLTDLGRGLIYLMCAILVALFNRWYWNKFDRTTRRRELPA